MNFKEALRNDLEHAFININEFAETTLFCGEEIPMIVESVASLEWQSAMPGLSRENVRLFFAKSAFLGDSDLYEQGAYLAFQGKDWIVESVKNDAGMVEITLSKEKVGFL